MPTPKYLWTWITAFLAAAMGILIVLYTHYVPSPKFWQLGWLWFGVFASLALALLFWLHHQRADVVHWASRVLAVIGTAALAYAVPAWIERAPTELPQAFTEGYPEIAIPEEVRWFSDETGFRVVFPDVYVANTTSTNMVYFTK